MSITRILGLLFFLAVPSSSLQAQGWWPEPHRLQDIKRQLLADTPSTVAFWRGDGSTSGVIVFHAVSDVSRPTEGLQSPVIWFARRVFQGSDDSLSTTYADSRDCPAIIGVLAWMERLDPPPVRFPGLLGVLPPGVEGPPLPRPPDPHAGRAGYTIWGRGFDANTQAVDISFTGATDLIADFGDAAVERLEPCWSPEPPERPRPPR